MKLQKSYLVASCLLLVFVVPLFAQNAYLRTTIRLGSGTTVPYCTPWVDSGAKAGTAWATTANYITIDSNTRYQPIIAWGGTIQEKHWQAISVLSAAGKDSVNRALFDTSGCNIGFLRCPIGCCDFDLNENPISLNDVANDVNMTNFSLHRDSLRKIPLIKMAQAIHPGLRFWGCPWSPPAWMHDNGQYSSGYMKVNDANVMNAYALYLSKYVQGYRAAGINVEYITCQNEPEITSGGYPKCGWYNTGFINFYKNYMIPRFNTDGLTTRILLGVFCTGPYADWITTIMNDATVRSFVGVTSHSYQSPSWGPQCRAAYPNIPFFQTEAPFHWPEDGIQDWTRGIEEFDNVSDFMSCSTSVYTMWNMVNDQTGASGWNWRQNVMIQVNSSTRAVTYNPHFWAYKHFGNYVKPGAYAIRRTVTGTGPAKSNAFRNPNGDIVLVISNNSSAYALTVRIGNTMWRASLPAYSFNTLRIATGTTSAVNERKLENTAMPALSNATIRNSTLYFSLSAAAGAQEMNITLSDLQGRTVWTGHRGGSAILGEQQTFSIRPTKGGLLPGTYLMTARIKNSAGAVTTVENKVTAVN
jgi:glucosylceramidase